MNLNRLRNCPANRLISCLSIAVFVSIAAYSFVYAAPKEADAEIVPYYKNGCRLDHSEADSTHDFDALEYSLTLYPYENDDQLPGEVELNFISKTAGLDTIFLHAEELEINGVSDETGALGFLLTVEGLKIGLREVMQLGDTSSVTVNYTAFKQPDHTTRGFHRDSDFCFTIAEPYGGRRWFPCYDLPFDKAQAEIEVFVPSGFKAASNGELAEITQNPPHDIYRWREDDPIATYLISIACGPYIKMTVFGADSLPFHYYVYPQDSAAAVYDFANTPDMVEFFSEIFVPYPFQMYGMAEANVNNGWGAMEHQTVTTYGKHLITGDRYYEYVVSHELSHMWWGDYITPLTFADIWLNEGFAVYSECLYVESRYDTLAEYLPVIANRYFGEYSNGYNYAIYDPHPFMFGTTVYNKGAYVQHMLRMVMGDEAFFTGLGNYLTDYAFGNVVTAEYQDEMETAYGGDLSWFFNEWVYQAGFPQYDYNWTVEQTGSDYAVDFDLTQVQTDGPVFEMPVELYFQDSQSDTLITVWNDQRTQSFAFTLDFSPSSFTLDPENKILKWDMPLNVQRWNTDQPVEFSLGTNYPNPFNSSTNIPFTLEKPGEISLDIYNILGEKTAVIFQGHLERGKYSVRWEAGGFASGVYWMALSDENSRLTRKLILLK